MKFTLLAFALAFSMGAMAAETTTFTDEEIAAEGRVTMKNDLNEKADTTKYNTTEAGVNFTSIDNGTAFIQVGLHHEFQNGFALGIRGNLPMHLQRETQVYLGQVVGRFMLMNEFVNRMYIAPVLTQGMTSNDSGTDAFAAIGGEYGFIRTIKRDLSVGANIGVDFSSSRVSKGTIRSVDTFYNHIGVMGTYAF